MVLSLEKKLPDAKPRFKIFPKRFLRPCVAAVLTFLFLYTYIITILPRRTSNHFNNESSFRRLLQNVYEKIHNPKKSSNTFRKRHLVLLWTPFFSSSNWLPSTKELHCPVENCDVTSDRLRYDESSAVILHWRDINPQEMPQCNATNPMSNSKCPLLVLLNNEAPPHTSASTIRDINNRIQWTISYRRDSDIISPYGKIVPVPESNFNMSDINMNRSNVCWLVSNCNTHSKRESFVNELKSFIDVEVYGKCGNSSCPYKKIVDCYKWMSDRCKFYLSFENTICKDYSTEKLYLAMMSDMVPVVLGGDDYARFLPPHSFINVKDFSSPKSLSKYLKDLIKDDIKYQSYFKWRKHYAVQNTSYTWYCDLCEKLQSTHIKNLKPHDDFIKWWYGESECLIL